MNKQRSTIVGLQHLRGIAALLVVIDHASGMMAEQFLWTPPPLDLLRFGWIGVDIFFVISGFIITLTAFDGPRLTPRVDKWEFFANRAVRILPLLWIVVIAYAVLRGFTGKFDDLDASIRAFFLFPIGEVRPNVVWTLRHELLFYTVFALTQFSKPWARPILWLWFISPLLLWAIQAGAGVTIRTNEIASFVFHPANIEFGAGFVAGVLYLRSSSFVTGFRLGGLPTLYVASGVTFLISARLNLHGVSLPGAAILCLLGAVLVAIALGVKDGPGRLSSMSRLIGDASYSLYLTHGIAILALLSVWQAAGLPRIPIMIEIVAVLVAIIAGIFVHLCVERPLLKLARARMRTIFPRQNAQLPEGGS
ncbi:acyltransferase family protein [Brevundimonas sp. TWP2-3-4b1]|uniref:acyltransferase family protein n=1 Tax=Brevundimonas sp. TWP2-3-4b1 TaxID=2804580 RepID=UPI003CED6C6A